MDILNNYALDHRLWRFEEKGGTNSLKHSRDSQDDKVRGAPSRFGRSWMSTVLPAVGTSRQPGQRQQVKSVLRNLQCEEGWPQRRGVLVIFLILCFLLNWTQVCGRLPKRPQILPGFVSTPIRSVALPTRQRLSVSRISLAL